MNKIITKTLTKSKFLESFYVRQYCLPLCDEISPAVMAILIQAKGLGRKEGEVKCFGWQPRICTDCWHNVSKVNGGGGGGNVPDMSGWGQPGLPKSVEEV
jgi:hypothetical protein